MVPTFIGGRNVQLKRITLEYDDAPGEPGTLWQVYQSQPGERVLVRIASDVDGSPDGVAEFPSANDAAKYIEEFYSELALDPPGWREFLRRLRALD